MNKVFKAAPSAYAILVGLTSVPAFIWLFGLLRGLPFDVEFAIATLVMPVGFSVCLAAFRLEISDDAITYRSLFGGTRRAKVGDIEYVGAARTAPASKSPLGLEIRLCDGTSLIISVKPFPKEAIAMLLSKRPNNAMHATCEDAHGDGGR